MLLNPCYKLNYYKTVEIFFNIQTKQNNWSTYDQHLCNICDLFAIHFHKKLINKQKILWHVLHSNKITSNGISKALPLPTSAMTQHI